MEMITGGTPDISEYLDYTFYDWVIFKENVIIGDTEIGRFLGVSHSFGNLMTYNIITRHGKVLSRSTVQRVTQLELQQEETKSKCVEFTRNLNEYLGDPASHLVVDSDPDHFYLELDQEEQNTVTSNYFTSQI